MGVSLLGFPIPQHFPLTSWNDTNSSWSKRRTLRKYRPTLTGRSGSYVYTFPCPYREDGTDLRYNLIRASQLDLVPTSTFAITSFMSSGSYCRHSFCSTSSLER
ncbi:MAG: hypothetical protein LIO77_01175 [Rikenellaceae bacterium]|nr:hypothetical protein [Rikenellaceae bacterium]